MTEVIKSTFSDEFPSITEAIKQCDFIAIDSEFTGLTISNDQKSSLFDDGAARYLKLRESITKITISQLGLSFFSKSSTENMYEAKTYNFYVYPSTYGPVDTRFVCQASSLKFLCKYGFDFNKFIYSGIPYLNEVQEKQIIEHISSKALFSGLERDLDEKAVQKICSKVAEWLVNSADDANMVLQKDEMEKLPMFVLSCELRGRFPTIWTTINKQDNTIQIEKISSEQRAELESTEADDQKQQEAKLVENALGFTRVFRLMKQYKKPIVGHNCLMDLMLFYDKFYQPLPPSYKEFKKNLHQIFPKIYDTKNIASSVRREFEPTGILQYTSLGELHRDLESDKGRNLVIYQPSIVHADGFNKYDDKEVLHEAGFDAYMSGSVFLRTAHILTFKDIPSSEVTPCMFKRYLQSLEQYENKVNIIRATVNHINIGGEDSVSNRPELLHVSSSNLTKKLNIDQVKLAKWFSPYGSVDVKPFGSSKALVACSTFRCSRDIKKAFRKHNSIRVTTYSVWKHSPVVRGILWSGVVITGGVLALTLLPSNKKT